MCVSYDRSWQPNVDERRSVFSTDPLGSSCRYIRADQKLNASISSSGCSDQPDQRVVFLEHVVVRVLMIHPRRGDVEISLVSPSGTRSQLLAQRWCTHTQHIWQSSTQNNSLFTLLTVSAFYWLDSGNDERVWSCVILMSAAAHWNGESAQTTL